MAIVSGTPWLSQRDWAMTNNLAIEADRGHRMVVVVAIKNAPRDLRREPIVVLRGAALPPGSSPFQERFRQYAFLP
jgi:hypothetical protein